MSNVSMEGSTFMNVNSFIIQEGGEMVVGHAGKGLPLLYKGVELNLLYKVVELK